MLSKNCAPRPWLSRISSLRAAALGVSGRLHLHWRAVRFSQTTCRERCLTPRAATALNPHLDIAMQLRHPAGHPSPLRHFSCRLLLAAKAVGKHPATRPACRTSRLPCSRMHPRLTSQKCRLACKRRPQLLVRLPSRAKLQHSSWLFLPRSFPRRAALGDHARSLLAPPNQAPWLLTCSISITEIGEAKSLTCRRPRQTMKETGTVPCCGCRDADKARAVSHRLRLMVAPQLLDRWMSSSAKTIPYPEWLWRSFSRNFDAAPFPYPMALRLYDTL